MQKKKIQNFLDFLFLQTIFSFNFLLQVPYRVHKHSIGSSYTKNDATVAYGYKDFVFTNSYDFPIKIEAYSYKAVISIKLHQER